MTARRPAESVRAIAVTAAARTASLESLVQAWRASVAAVVQAATGADYFLTRAGAATALAAFPAATALPALQTALKDTSAQVRAAESRSEEHTSELQSRRDLVCRL